MIILSYTRRSFLKALGLGATTLAAQSCASISQLITGKASEDKPNIIFILADDLGRAELRCYGNKFNETPNLDKLASEGMRFTEAYAAAPVCSPYRAALMTGQYPARVGITDYLRPNDAKHLSTDYVTIAEMLKRAGKSTLYEGGIREPLLIRWPGVVKAKSVCNTPTCNIDFYPTFLQILGRKVSRGQHIDGIPILPLLKNPKAELERDTFYWHYPLEKAHFLGGRSAGAIRQGSFKLIEFFDTDQVELYNLADDVSEEHNLAAEMPNEVTEMQKRLAKWRAEVGASLPAGQERVLNYSVLD